MAMAGLVIGVLFIAACRSLFEPNERDMELRDAGHPPQDSDPDLDEDEVRDTGSDGRPEADLEEEEPAGDADSADADSPDDADGPDGGDADADGDADSDGDVDTEVDGDAEADADDDEDEDTGTTCDRHLNPDPVLPMEGESRFRPIESYESSVPAAPEGVSVSHVYACRMWTHETSEDARDALRDSLVAADCPNRLEMLVDGASAYVATLDLPNAAWECWVPRIEYSDGCFPAVTRENVQCFQIRPSTLDWRFEPPDGGVVSDHSGSGNSGRVGEGTHSPSFVGDGSGECSSTPGPDWPNAVCMEDDIVVTDPFSLDSPSMAIYLRLNSIPPSGRVAIFTRGAGEDSVFLYPDGRLSVINNISFVVQHDVDWTGAALTAGGWGCLVINQGDGDVYYNGELVANGTSGSVLPGSQSMTFGAIGTAAEPTRTLNADAALFVVNNGARPPALIGEELRAINWLSSH